MPSDTTNEVETTASSLMDKVGKMMTDAAEAVQDFAANVMGHGAEDAAAAITAEDDAEPMDDDEDDMDDEEADADETEEA